MWVIYKNDLSEMFLHTHHIKNYPRNYRGGCYSLIGLHCLLRQVYLNILTLVLLNPDIPCLCKQCRSRSVGFCRSQLIWICTVCHEVCEFIAIILIKQSDWLKIRSRRGINLFSKTRVKVNVVYFMTHTSLYS